MVKIAWKVHKGCGPYAYLQKSVRRPNGKVYSEHLAYLGKLGTNGLVPGGNITLDSSPDGKESPWVHHVPPGNIDDPKAPFWVSAPAAKTLERLKPHHAASVEAIHRQLESGVLPESVRVPPVRAMTAASTPKPTTPSTPDKTSWPTKNEHRVFYRSHNKVVYYAENQGISYEWDLAKWRNNQEDHDVDFYDVDRFNWDTTVTRPSKYPREARWESFGLLGSRLRALIWTWRSDNVRVISFRAASQVEREFYERERSSSPRVH